MISLDIFLKNKRKSLLSIFWGLVHVSSSNNYHWSEISLH